MPWSALSPSLIPKPRFSRLLLWEEVSLSRTSRYCSGQHQPRFSNLCQSQKMNDQFLRKYQSIFPLGRQGVTLGKLKGIPGMVNLPDSGHSVARSHLKSPSTTLMRIHKIQNFLKPHELEYFEGTKIFSSTWCIWLPPTLASDPSIMIENH